MEQKRGARKRRSIFWAYLCILAALAVAVVLFALLYNGGGAHILTAAGM